MAITYLVGIPRSGKSYYAVYQLWKSFVYIPKENFYTKLFKIKPKIKHYDYAYTNINQFDFSKSPKFKKLDFDDLKEKLVVLYNLYIQKQPDSVLVDKAKEFLLHNVLIVIDECHNFLGDKADDVLVWWLTYHGHLFQDLFLITQDLSLINAKYKSNAEFFYKAVPPSKRLNPKKFRYTQYINSRMAMNGKVKDFTVPALQDVFNMYVSGAENKSKSFVLKYIYISIFFLILVLILGYYFIKSFNTSDNNTVQASSKNSPNVSHSVNTINVNKNVVKSINDDTFDTKSNNSLSGLLFKSILCLNSICSYKDNHFSLSTLKLLINQSKSTVIDIEIYSKHIVKLNLLLSKDFQNYFKDGQVEKGNHFNSGIISSFSK